MKNKIGVLLIATNKYKQFVQPLLDGIEKNFMTNHDVNIFLFTDEVKEHEIGRRGRLNIYQIKIPAYRFPEATLYRYRIFEENKEALKGMDYLFYSDVDMGFVAPVGEEILHDGLTAVHHPGFFKNNGWGSGGCVKESLAYLPTEQRHNYCAGGFQGGRSGVYLTACNILNARIQDDEERRVQAEWHDETHWNWLLNCHQIASGYKKLTPEYCMVEQYHLRKLWGIENLQPKIIALAKNHEELRK